jgi:hypothetical protein
MEEGFDKEMWPLNRQKPSEAFTFYGFQPYWQTGVTEQARL